MSTQRCPVCKKFIGETEAGLGLDENGELAYFKHPNPVTYYRPYSAPACHGMCDPPDNKMIHVKCLNSPKGKQIWTM